MIKGNNLLSLGNRKLQPDIAIWNLPHRKTCPGATAECKKYCYAQKAERLYKATLPFRERNFKLSKKANFAKTMIEALSKIQHKVRAVRIHESGDFYNQEYLDKWVEVAKAFPKIMFTAYTKSLHLDFSKAKKTKNMILFASIDPTTPDWMLKKNTLRHKATVIKPGCKVPRGYFECPGSCRKAACEHCYHCKTKSVAFHQH